MGNKTIQEKLKELAESDPSRSAAARLRDIIDDVDAAIASGVKISVIRKTLSESGLNFTEASFIGTRARIKKNKGAAMKAAPKTTTKPLDEKINKASDQTNIEKKSNKFVFNNNPDPKDLI